MRSEPDGLAPDCKPCQRLRWRSAIVERDAKRASAGAAR